MKIVVKRKIDTKASAAEIVEKLLSDRKITNIKEFLNPPLAHKIELGSFFKKSASFKSQMDKTFKLLKQIHESKKTIVVYTDYDADGITGGAILWETLHLLGFSVMPYVPDRKTEGYGFSKKGIDATRKQFAPALIISVDHGIVAHEKISYAKSLGIPIIVTDHHQKLDTEPKDAYAIFHTDKISGAGVAYFFAKEVFKKFASSAKNRKQLSKNFETDFLALASIGTIADLVPIVGPARSIVKHGLNAFSQVSRVGLRHLLKEAQIEGRVITPYEVGFIIAPRINAIGRLEHAIDALRLLCTVSEEKAVNLAAKAGSVNRLRQDLVTSALEEAEKMVNPKDTIIILKSTTWLEGIIGLIASKIAEKYYRPTIVMTGSGRFAKASARSIRAFDITAFLRSLKEYLVDVGGHAAAAGFTIEASKIDGFTKAAQKKAKAMIKKEDLIPQLRVDMEIPLSAVTLGLVNRLESLEPFGIGNPRPVFYSEGELLGARTMGKNNDHLKITITQQDAFPLEIVFFGEGSQFAQLSRGQKIKVVYSLEIDRWNGREAVKGMGKHFS